MDDHNGQLSKQIIEGAHDRIVDGNATPTDNLIYVLADLNAATRERLTAVEKQMEYAMTMPREKWLWGKVSSRDLILILSLGHIGELLALAITNIG